MEASDPGALSVGVPFPDEKALAQAFMAMQRQCSDGVQHVQMGFVSPSLVLKKCRECAIGIAQVTKANALLCDPKLPLQEGRQRCIVEQGVLRGLRPRGEQGMMRLRHAFL